MIGSGVTELSGAVEYFFGLGAAAVGNAEAETAFAELRTKLEAGELRAAEPDAGEATGWRVNAWVKRGILLGFRLGHLVAFEGGKYVDKNTYPARSFTAEEGVRIVAGRKFGAGGGFRGEGCGGGSSGLCEYGGVCG